MKLILIRVLEIYEYAPRVLNDGDLEDIEIMTSYLEDKDAIGIFRT